MSEKNRNNKNKNTHSLNKTQKSVSSEKRKAADETQPSGDEFEKLSAKIEETKKSSDADMKISGSIKEDGFLLSYFDVDNREAKKLNDGILENLSENDIKIAHTVKKKSSLKEVLRRLGMACMLFIIVVFSLNIVRETLLKHKADIYYTKLSEKFYSGEILYDSPRYLSKDSFGDTEERLYSDEGDIYKGTEIAVEDLKTKFERMLPNLEALKLINPSAFAWIKVQGTRVDYPVVQSPQGDNDFYLSHGFDRTYSVSGAIFTDYNNKKDLEKNRNTCVYGHNMNDGTMFQTIMNFRTKNQFQNGQIEIYTADGVYIYKPFSAYDAVPTERFFYTEFSSDEDFEEFLSEIKSKSIFKSDVSLDKDDKIVTLITCTNGVVDKRFVVHGVLEKSEKIS
ncbi:MAG: class B sortase [Ruminococcaceae bacterium]|nr:class B sortase [Oscillospiraceae bacterium]